MKALSGVILGVVAVLVVAIAWAQEPLAVLTEMRVKHGKVEVKTAADPDWQVPDPRQAQGPPFGDIRWRANAIYAAAGWRRRFDPRQQRAPGLCDPRLRGRAKGLCREDV